MERNIARGSGKVSAVVTAAVPLASLISLISGCLGQFLRFLFSAFDTLFVQNTLRKLLEN